MFVPYVETPTIFRIISASMSNSINTSDIDAYRQGIEITEDKFFYIGSIAKIHVGEPHNLEKSHKKYFKEPQTLRISMTSIQPISSKQRQQKHILH